MSRVLLRVSKKHLIARPYVAVVVPTAHLTTPTPVVFGTGTVPIPPTGNIISTVPSIQGLGDVPELCTGTSSINVPSSTIVSQDYWTLHSVTAYAGIRTPVSVLQIFGFVSSIGYSNIAAPSPIVSAYSGAYGNIESEVAKVRGVGNATVLGIGALNPGGPIMRSIAVVPKRCVGLVKSKVPKISAVSNNTSGTLKILTKPSKITAQMYNLVNGLIYVHPSICTTRGIGSTESGLGVIKYDRPQ
jgi:hypothetical protein